MKIFKNGSDTVKFRSFDYNTSSGVEDELKTIMLRLSRRELQ